MGSSCLVGEEPQDQGTSLGGQGQPKNPGRPLRCPLDLLDLLDYSKPICLLQTFSFLSELVLQEASSENVECAFLASRSACCQSSPIFSVGSPMVDGRVGLSTVLPFGVLQTSLLGGSLNLLCFPLCHLPGPARLGASLLLPLVVQRPGVPPSSCLSASVLEPPTHSFPQNHLF